MKNKSYEEKSNLLQAHRELRKLRRSSSVFDETSLGAAYGSYINISDAMT